MENKWQKFEFLDSQITANVISREIEDVLTLVKKSCDPTDIFANSVSQKRGFSSSRYVKANLNKQKLMFWTNVLEKTLNNGLQERSKQSVLSESV